MTRVLFAIPPGFGAAVSHHEGTSGMGALVPGDDAFFYPPHTAAVCAATARARGLASVVLDGTRRGDSAAFAREVLAEARDAAAVAVLASPGTLRADENFLRQLRLLSGTGAGLPPLLAFGPASNYLPRAWLDGGLITAILTGEPEGAIGEALARLADGALTGNIAAAELAPDLYTGTSLRDLDALPFPDWESVPWQAYGAVSTLTSRGCPTGCSYCAYTVPQGVQFRAQGVERTVAEWTWLAERIAPPKVYVRDPVFAHDGARVASLCERLAARGVRLRFTCESRPEQFDDELLRLLKAAGCYQVKIGLESADPALLVSLRRAQDVAHAEAMIAQTRRVARTCAALDMRCQVYVMAGLPRQDAASLARTEAFVGKLPAQTSVSAKRYEWHAGADLQEPGGAVTRETLDRLEGGSRGAGGLRRAVSGVLSAAAASVRARWAGTPRRGTDADRATIPLRGTSARIAPTDTDRVPAEVAPTENVPALEPLRGARVFVTGGNGFLGGWVVQALLEQGAEVTALVRHESELGGLNGLPVAIVRGELADPASWAGTLAGCEFCFHLAALHGGPPEAEHMMVVNVGGTINVVAACAEAGVRRLVHTSTIGTVGRPADASALPDEGTPFNLWESGSHYVRTKYLGEQAALSWNGTGVEVVVVKPTAPVGAGDARPTATGRRILAAMRGLPGPYPAGDINFVPVRDAAAGHLLAAAIGRPGATYILGHREGNLDRAAFLRHLARSGANLPAGSTGRPAVAQGGQPAGLTADPARAIGELGMPQSDLGAAFAEAVEWFRARMDREDG